MTRGRNLPRIPTKVRLAVRRLSSGGLLAAACVAALSMYGLAAEGAASAAGWARASGQPLAATASMLPAPPPAPTALPATNVSSSGFTANWSSSSGATGYRLDVSLYGDFSFFVPGYQDLDVGNVLTYTVGPVAPNEAWYYRVRAYNADGTSGNSNTVFATPDPRIIGCVVSARTGGVPGVVMVGLPGGPVTDSSGCYIATVPLGWSGTVTPAKPGWIFQPPSMQYTNVRVDQFFQHYQALAAPAITSPASAAFYVDRPDTFTVTTTGSPAPTLTQSGTLPAGVAFADNGDGSAALSGTPARGTKGDYALTFTAANSAGSTGQTFVLTVAPNPAGPTVSDVPDQTILEDTVLGPLAFTVVWPVMPNPRPRTVSATSTNQALVPDGNVVVGGDTSNCTLMITPIANAYGSTTITISANNLIYDDSDTFVLTVTPVNDRPVANPQSVTTMQNVAVAMTLTGSDVETPTLGFALTRLPAHGNMSGTPPHVTYTPAASYWGPDSFDFTVNDGSLTSQPATVSVDVTSGSATPGFDFDGDGKPDVFFRHAVTGEDVVWYMNGTISTGYGRIATVADTSWKVVAIADFDGNGRPDVVWRSSATGENILWYMNGLSCVGYTRLRPVASLDWQIVGAADFTGDGRPDLLWRNPTTGENIVWHMNNAAQTGYTRLRSVAGTAHEMVAAADFTGDGKADILWRRPATGENIVWEMNGTTYVRYRFINAVAGSEWQVGMAADFNADGKPDILWRSSTTGENVVWWLDGTTYAGYARVRTVADLSWKIVPGQR